MNLQLQDINTPNSSRYKSQDLFSELNLENVPVVKMDLAQERKTISHWSRDDLEDKYLRLMDDHQILKKHARLQEMKIKKMGTKMLKLASDAKKSGDVILKKDDSDDLARKCSIYESQNNLLKDKLRLLQSQLAAQGKKLSIYDNVPSRINSGNVERPSSGIQNSARKNNIRILKPRGELFPLSSQGAKNTSSDQSNTELNKLVENLKHALHKEQVEKEELINKMSWNEEHLPNLDYRSSNLKENLDYIRLGRDVKEKEVQINVMQSKYEDLKMKQQHLERTNREMSNEIDRLNHILKSNDDFSGSDGQVRNASVLKKRIVDLELMNNDFKKEIYLLKESNHKLTNDAFNIERERDWREKEMNYRTKIAQLETTLKRDLGEKDGVLNKLESERYKSDNVEKEMSNLRLRNYELQGKIDELNEKLKYFSKDSSLNPQEIEEALMIIQQKRNMVHAQSTPELDFIEKVDKKKEQDITRRLQESERNHADTIQELEKTRSLLRTQYKITNDYKQEADKISSRMTELKTDYENRLSEYAKLLDIRAARIHKLEAQMKDIAYGTRNTQISAIIERDLEPASSEILEQGENIFEIHIGRVCLTQQAIESIKDKEPYLFGTWDFYDFETQATGILRGTSSDFDIKAEYVVKIDDFFLNYLFKNTFSFELHQSIGAEFVTLAACQMNCRELFERTSDQGNKLVNDKTTIKYNCKSKLVGLQENSLDMTFGVLEYWIKFRYPMDQVIRQYREKLKVEAYILGNEVALSEATRPIQQMNELVIRVVRCQGLKSRQKHLQPSSYIAYTFYDHNPHTSVTIPYSNNPEFHDLKRYPLQMNSDIHEYLKSQLFQIYVFDELDPDETVYLGMSSIPLIPLCHNKTISGSFELFDSNKEPNGTMELDVQWQHSYLFQDDSYGETNLVHSVVLLPGEDSIVKEKEKPVRQLSSPSKEKITAEVVKPEKEERVKKDQPKKKERQKKPNQEKSIEEGVISASSSNTPIVKSILRKTDQSKPEKSLNDSLKDQDVVDKFVMPDVDLKISSPTKGSLSKSASEEEIKATSSLEKSSKLKDNLESGDRKVDKISMKEDNETVKSPSKTSSTSIIDSVSATNKSDDKKKNVQKKILSKNVSEKNVVTSENEDVVLADKKVKKVALEPDQNPDEIVVEVLSVEFVDNTEILKDGSIQFLFIEYRIPGISSELTETMSMRKPSVNQEIKKMIYNSKKTFDVSLDNNYVIRQHIATMLTEDFNKFIVFTLVQEPSEESNSDCEDIATAKVNVKSILKDEKNLENERIPLYNFKDKNEIIGHVNVSIKILGVLKAIEKELKQS